MSSQARDKDKQTTIFISTDSISRDDLCLLWDDIVLTAGEEQVLNALGVIEHDIDRIAALVSRRSTFIKRRGGFIVKIKGNAAPIPIGSLGDGIWRLLAVAVALVNTKGGFLLVDEIDTGLHYTVMAKMWKLIAEMVKALDVQVFATTHSHDCVSALASICREGVVEGSEVTIQRIERDQEKAVPYTEADIKITAEHHIEVR